MQPCVPSNHNNVDDEETTAKINAAKKDSFNLNSGNAAHYISQPDWTLNP